MEHTQKRQPQGRIAGDMLQHLLALEVLVRELPPYQFGMAVSRFAALYEGIDRVNGLEFAAAINTLGTED